MASERTTTEVSKPRRRKVKVVDEIIESLRQDIVTRRLPDGARLPSEKELSDQFRVSQPTVSNAYVRVKAWLRGKEAEAMDLVELQLRGRGMVA